METPYTLADAERIIDALLHENVRLRKVMRKVYYVGASEPGSRAATMVEPLWKALQRPVEEATDGE